MLQPDIYKGLNGNPGVSITSHCRSPAHVTIQCVAAFGAETTSTDEVQSNPYDDSIVSKDVQWEGDPVPACLH